MATNYNAVKKLNQAKAQRQAQLAQAYEDLGGVSPAYKPIQTNNVLASPQRMSASIPKLEQAVVNAYEGNETQRKARNTNPVSLTQRSVPATTTGGGGHHGFGGANPGPIFKKNTDSFLKDDRGQARQDYAPLYNDILDRQLEEKFRKVGINSVNDLPDIITQSTIMGQGNGMYGKPTPEMQALGITQEDIQRYLDPRRIAEAEAKAQSFAESHPVLATGAAVVSNPIESAIGNLQQVSDRITGKPLTQAYAPSTIMRNTVSEGINSDLGKIAYGGVNSIGDMAMALTLGKILGGGNNQAVSRIAAGIMGSEKANDTMNSAIERGLNPNQVLAEGATSALSTYLSEVALGPLENIAGGQGNILLSAGKEGLQEGIEDLIDTLFDQAITLEGGNVDRSELAQNYNAYINAGYSAEDAKSQTVIDYIKQVGIDAALGGITGGLMQGGTNAMSGNNIFTGNPRNTSVETNINTPNIVDDLNSASEDVINKPSAEKYFQFEDRVREAVKENPDLVEQIRPIFEKVQQYYDENEANIPESINENVDNVKENVDTPPQTDVTPNANDTVNEWDAQRQATLNQEFAQLNRLVEEQQAETRRNEDLARLNEALKAENARGEIERLENRRQEDLDRIMNAMLAQPSVNQNIPTVEQTPVQNEIPVIPREPRASRADVSAAINTANGIRENLGFFKEKNARTLEKRIDNAIEKVRTTTGQAQIDAIQDLNNTLDGVRNVMQYSTIGIDERSLNSDGFERMHNVTDGRKIKVTPSMLRDLNISLTQLNNMTNTGTSNRIRFYAENNPNAISLDAVWNEMVEQSGNELPRVSEGDQLSALVNYINEYKSKKGSEVNTVSFNDMPVTDSRPAVVKEWEAKADSLVDRMLEGDYTEQEVQDLLDGILEAGNKLKKNPEAQQMLADLWAAVKYADRVKPQSTIKLDDDIKAINTPEQAQQTLEEAINGLAMNLGFFGSDVDEETESEPTETGRVKTGRFKTSDVFSNTAKNSGILNEKQQKMHEADGSMLYEQNSEKESVDAANQRIKENGYNGEYERLLKKEGYNNVDTDEMMMIWKHYNNQALALDERGADSTSAWKKAYECLKKIKAEGSREGSALQALAKWSRNNTPEGLLAQAESIITAAQNGYSGYSKTDQGWFKQIAKETKGKTKEMDVDFIKGFITEARKLEGLDINSQQAKHIMANLGKMVNSQIPVTLREKVTTILMDNMLGNFRTLITRNAGGNIAFNAIEQKLRKPLSALIDAGISKAKGTERTISENTAEGRSAYREGFKEALKQEMYDFANNIQSARSGENTLATAVTNNRQVFKDSNILGKVGNFYNKLVKAGLSAGDRPFYEGVYHQYMTEFQKMYDDGKLGDMKESDFKKLAEANAQLKALEAVYQDDSAMASAFMKMKEGVNNLSQGIIGADLLSQFTMPFVKTPANIIQRAIEYSPIGIVKNAIQTVREVNHAMTDAGMMDFNQERFATETARNLIGSVLFTAAVMLAKSGAMTGAYSEDKDMAQAQREAGMQEYALHNPLGFNGDISVDWIPVLGNDMVAAASAYDAFKNNPELNAAQRIGRGLTAGLKSQFESSMLQGLQRLVGGSGSFGSEGDILTNAVDTLKSGATQFIPSLLRQGAAVMDPYRRQLSGANPDDYYVNSVLNSIPGLRETLEPRVSRTGENLEQNAGRSFGWKVFDNFINPATVTVGTPDNVRDEAMRLYESTNSNQAFEPTVTISELKVDDHVPTAEEYTEYQRNAYGAMNEVASQVIESEYYNGLSDDDKVSMLADIYSAIKTVEKKNVLGLDTSNLTGADKAYFEGGTDGLIEYMTVRSVLSQMGMQNNASNREQIMNVLNQGGVDAVNQMVEESQELEAAGLNTNMQFKYEHATNYIPSLTPTQFANTWNEINTDGNTGIKQQEILDYLNQNPQSHVNDAMLYWQAYGDSSWTKVPVLNEDGVWVAQK